MPVRVRLSLLLTGTILQTAAWGAASAQDLPDGSLLETVTVTPDAPDRSDVHAGAADRAQSIYIPLEELQRTDPQSLRDVFSGTASISVGGGIAVAQKVFVNGIDENNLAVSVDGVAQGNRIFHHTNTNYVDPGLLKAVRVDPAVAPADAGFGALAGSIVYETVDVGDLLIGDRAFGGFASASYETNGGTLTRSGAAYARHQGVELLGYARFADGDDYQDGTGFAIPGTAAGFHSLLAKAAYEAGNGYRVELSGQHVVDDTQRPFRANIGGLNGSYDLRTYDLKRTNVAFSFGRDDTLGLWNPKAVIGYSANDYRVPDPYGSEGFGSTWTAKLENVFDFGGRNTVTAGVDLLSQLGDYSDPAEAYTEKLGNVGAYVQARLRPVDRIALSFGARADGNRFEGKDGTTLDTSGLSGNVFAEVDLVAGFSVNAGYSNVFGGIDLEETFEYWRPWSYAGLKPVRSDNLTAGLKFEQAGWFAEGNLFNTRVSNYRDGDGNTDFSSWGFNLAGGYSWGDGFAKLSYADTRLALADAAIESYALINIGAGVGRIVSGEVAQTFDRVGVTLGASFDAALEYDGSAAAGFEPFDAYTVVNAYAEYAPEQIEALSLRLEANNIFDEAYADRATYGQEYASITPLFEPGRSLRLTAKLRY